MSCDPTPFGPKQSPYARVTSPYTRRTSPFGVIAKPFNAMLAPFGGPLFCAVLLYETGYPVLFDDGVTIKL